LTADSRGCRLTADLGGSRLKIHAYRVDRQGPLQVADLIAAIDARPLSDRFFHGDGQVLRLEDSVRDGDFLLLEFAGARTGHGPGRMSRDRPMAHIDLDSDETFGEDTAVAYHVPSGYAAVQYNHYGPRATAIERYLNAAAGALATPGPTAYALGVCLRGEAYQRLAQLGFIQEVDFTIAIPGILPGDADNGVSVGAALRAPLPEGVEVISMQLRGRAGRPLGRDSVLTMVDELLRRGGDLHAARVWGKSAPGVGRKRPVDLVNDQLSADVEIRPARGHRYARPERWNGLARTLHEWLASRQLQV
jgi:hypothetical protein